MSTPPSQMPSGAARATAELWILEFAAAHRPENGVLAFDPYGPGLHIEVALELGRQLRDWGYLGDGDGADEMEDRTVRVATTGLTVQGRTRIDDLRQAKAWQNTMYGLSWTPAAFLIGVAFGLGQFVFFFVYPALFTGVR